MHRSDVVKIYYFLVTRAEKGKGREEDEIYGVLCMALIPAPISVWIEPQLTIIVVAWLSALEGT